MDVYTGQNGGYVVMDMNNQQVPVATNPPTTQDSNGYKYVLDVSNNWVPVALTQSYSGQQQQPYPSAHPQGYPQQHSVPRAATIPMGQMPPHHQRMAPAQQFPNQPPVQGYNPYLRGTREDPRLSGQGKAVAIDRTRGMAPPVPPYQAPTAEQAHYQAMVPGENGPSNPAPSGTPIKPYVLEPTKVVEPTVEVVEEVVPEVSQVPQHQVETYLYDALFNVNSELSVNHTALREFYSVIAMRPNKLREHVKELSMNRKSHKDLYNTGTGGSVTIKGKDGEVLEPLPEIVTALSMVDDIENRPEGSLAEEATFYIWNRYLSIDSGLAQNDNTVIKKMIGTLGTMFEMFNTAYDHEESTASIRIEIRDMDKFLTKVANLYLKYVCQLEITFDSVRSEFEALKEIANGGEVPGLDNTVINNLSAFILGLITFSGDSTANIAEEDAPVLSICIPFIEHECNAADLNLTTNATPVTGENTFVIASELINQELYMVLESFDGEETSPIMTMLRLNDGDFCAIAINGGWVVISTIPV